MAKGYGVTKIRNTTISELASLFGENEARAIKGAIKREPIPNETIVRLMVESDWKCCICWNVDKVRPVIIHHIVEYSKTQDNSYENLVVICPNHHADAHSKSDLAGEILPAELIRERKKQFSIAISEWKKGERLAPGREYSDQYTERQKEFLKQKQRVEARMKKERKGD